MRDIFLHMPSCDEAFLNIGETFTMSHPVMDVNWTRSSVICPQGAGEIWRPQRKEGREEKWM